MSIQNTLSREEGAMNRDKGLGLEKNCIFLYSNCNFPVADFESLSQRKTFTEVLEVNVLDGKA
jgi:hypothetical protein